MGGERVTRSEWLYIAAPLVAIIGVFVALIAFGFAAQKHWSRHLLIAMFSLIIVYASALGALNLIHHAVMWRAIINATVFGAIAVWYFYIKPSVASYFRELRDRHNLKGTLPACPVSTPFGNRRGCPTIRHAIRPKIDVSLPAQPRLLYFRIDRQRSQRVSA
jgi:hypothetical protein